MPSFGALGLYTLFKNVIGFARICSVGVVRECDRDGALGIGLGLELELDEELELDDELELDEELELDDELDIVGMGIREDMVQLSW